MTAGSARQSEIQMRKSKPKTNSQIYIYVNLMNANKTIHTASDHPNGTYKEQQVSKQINSCENY